MINRRHLEGVLPIYIEHYNTHRPHRSLQQRPPTGGPQQGSATVVTLERDSTPRRPRRTHPRIPKCRVTTAELSFRHPRVLLSRFVTPVGYANPSVMLLGHIPLMRPEWFQNRGSHGGMFRFQAEPEF
jgi:hypothetical protein